MQGTRKTSGISTLSPPRKCVLAKVPKQPVEYYSPKELPPQGSLPMPEAVGQAACCLGSKKELGGQGNTPSPAALGPLKSPRPRPPRGLLSPSADPSPPPHPMILLSGPPLWPPRPKREETQALGSPAARADIVAGTQERAGGDLGGRGSFLLCSWSSWGGTSRLYPSA